MVIIVMEHCPGGKLLHYVDRLAKGTDSIISDVTDARPNSARAKLSLELLGDAAKVVNPSVVKS